MTDEARAAQRAYLAAWRKKNPDKVREHNRRYLERRAEKLTAERGEKDGTDAAR